MLSQMKIYINKTVPIILFLLSIFLTPGYTQINELPRKSKKGLCYEKLHRPSEPETWQEYHDYPIYTGMVSDGIDFDTVQLIISPRYVTYETRRIDDNCESPDPKDCLVICAVEYPEVREEVIFMTDTTQSGDFIWETFEVTRRNNKNAPAQWIYVLCGQKLPDKYKLKLFDICTKLKNEGYFSGEFPTKKLTAKLKYAILKYQSDNYIPGERINIETLNVLAGIEN